MSEEVTVLVFKDDRPARTFKVPLKWISRFGAALALLVGAIFLTIFLTAKYYRVASQSSPSRVQQLEYEFAELQDSYRELENAAREGTYSTPVGEEKPVDAAQTTAESLPDDGLPAAPSVPETNTATALFTALPVSVGTGALPSNPAIQLDRIRTTWKDGHLIVNFIVQYVKNDNGSQQGRIVILARGPETLLAYPKGVLNAVGSDSLVAPDRGEYFSVSRFRQSRADFGPLPSKNAIKDVQVLIFSTKGKLILVQKIENKT